MTNKMKKAGAFKGVLALIVGMLLLVFSGCKQSKGGGTGGKNTPTVKKYKVELVQTEGGTVSYFLFFLKITWSKRTQNFFSQRQHSKVIKLINGKLQRLNDDEVENKDAEGKVKTTYQHKVTADLDVKVKFENYAKIPYDELEAYLKSSATYKDMMNYIEVIGEIPLEDFWGSEKDPGAFGKKLKQALDKKITLKINYPSGLEEMSSCFIGCTNLVALEKLPPELDSLFKSFEGCVNLSECSEIPEGVTHMKSCFDGCTNLIRVTNIPETVKYLEACFRNCENLVSVPAIPQGAEDLEGCFYNCKKLKGVIIRCAYNAEEKHPQELGSPTWFATMFGKCTAIEKGGIKVDKDHYAGYTTANALDDMKVPGDTEAEKREKFSKYN